MCYDNSWTNQEKDLNKIINQAYKTNSIIGWLKRQTCLSKYNL